LVVLGDVQVDVLDEPGDGFAQDQVPKEGRVDAAPVEALSELGMASVPRAEHAEKEGRRERTL